jgi:hypothetical protein
LEAWLKRITPLGIGLPGRSKRLEEVAAKVKAAPFELSALIAVAW